MFPVCLFFFFNDTATTEIYTLSLHDALPISIAVLDSLRFGPITQGSGASEKDVERNRRILDGVIRGIGFYGNCFGVPTIGGEVQFEPCYANNPLVNALALGIARRE